MTKSAKWKRRFVELAVIVAIFFGLSAFLARNMLPDASTAPELRLPELASTAPESSAIIASETSIDWQAAERTLVYFFAPWCGVCRVSMPSLSLLNQNSAQVVVVALGWETAEQVSDFVTEVGYQGQVLLGTQATKAAFQVDAYPSYYVVDNRGQVLHRDRGFSTPLGLWFRLQ